MTTIVGLQGDGWCVLGADSRVSSIGEDGAVLSQQVLPKSSGKLISKGPYLLGAAGDVRAINILHHVFEPPPPPRAKAPDKVDQHIVRLFIPALRQCFDKEGYSPPERGDRDHQAIQHSTVIIALFSRIYLIDNDYSWAPDSSGIYATGTGYQYAYGALNVLVGKTTSGLTKEKAQAAVKKALSVATDHDPFTGPPHYIHTQTT